MNRRIIWLVPSIIRFIRASRNIRSTAYPGSPRPLREAALSYPLPPRICRVSSITFQDISAQNILAIAASRRISNFLASAICEESQVRASMARVFAAISDNFTATPSCSPIGSPHCFLSLDHLRATARHHLLIPAVAAGIVSLPVFKVTKAIFSPSPSAPKIFSLGTLTLLNFNNPNFTPCRPIKLQW